MDTTFKQHWTNSGFLKQDKLYKYLKEHKVKATHAQVKDFLQKQLSIQITKKQTKQKHYSSIVAGSVGAAFQMDIMVYNRNAYNGYTYIIGVIDVHSRYVACKALKTRKQSEYLPKLIEIFKEMGNPVNLNCDNEFKTREFLKYCTDNNIKLWFSNPDEITGKNAIIERFWKTLAEKIRDYTINTSDRNWVKNLNKIVMNYNYIHHSTINEKPVKIFKGIEQNKQTIKIVQKTFKIGDIVRVKINKKSVFDKGDVETYSRDLYKLLKHDESRANRWVLLNTNTNTILKRGYLERDFMRIHEVELPEKPLINVEKVKQTIRRTRNTALEFKQLEISASGKLNKAKNTKRITKNTVFIIQRLIRMKKVDGKVFVLVKWKGYGPKFDTYEPLDVIQKAAPDLVKKLMDTSNKK